MARLGRKLWTLAQMDRKAHSVQKVRKQLRQDQMDHLVPKAPRGQIPLTQDHSGQTAR